MPTGTAANSELRTYLQASGCARAVVGILSALRQSDAGGLSVLALSRLLASRFSRSAIEQAVLTLRRLGRLRFCGVRQRSKQWRAVV